MKHKKILILVLAAAVIASLVLAGCAKPVTPPEEGPAEGPAPEQEVIKWRMATTWTPAIALIEGDRMFCRNVKEMSGGRMEITLYSAGELMPAFEVFDAVSSGMIECGGDWPGYWAGKDTAFEILGTHPFGLNWIDYAIWVLHGGGYELMNELFGQYNMLYITHSITSVESGFRTNVPIETASDFKGLKIRLSGALMGRVLEELGASPVSLAGGEIYTALATGTIDGAEYTCPGVDWGMGFAEVTKYWCLPTWHQPSSLLGVMINKDAWNELPDDLQAIVLGAAKAGIAESCTWYEYDNIEALQNFRNAGVVETWLDQESRDMIEAMVVKFTEEEAAKNPMYAKILKSQYKYFEDFAPVRELEGEYGFGKTPVVWPKLD